MTRQIPFDKTRLETLLCRVKATLEIKKRHGNSRKKFATEKETFLDYHEILIVSGKFNIELILRCLSFKLLQNCLTCNVAFCDLNCSTSRVLYTVLHRTRHLWWKHLENDTLYNLHPNLKDVLVFEYQDNSS